MEYLEIDMKHFNRRDHFEHFRKMDYPFCGATVQMDITKFLQHIQTKQRSFFLSVLYEAVNTANHIDAFRQRIKDDRIIQYASCESSHTVLKEDKTYCYCKLDCSMPKDVFFPYAVQMQEEAKQRGTIEEDEDYLSYYFVTTLPWISYSTITQAIANNKDSNPRISWGKYYQQGTRTILPVTVLGNHALIDGWHLHLFFDELSKRLSMNDSK